MRPLIAALLAVLRAALVRRANLAVENAALRQQLAVYLRLQKRPRVEPEDRIFWVALKRIWSGWDSALIIVRPKTVIGWHKKGFRVLWRRKSKGGKPGRPRIPREHIAFIKRMSRDHPDMGENAIAEELEAKFGIKHAPSTVGRYMVREGKGPRGDQTWRTFVRNHAKEVWSCDFLVQHTAMFARVYVFVIMEIESRRIVHANVTASPSIAWVKQQIRNATPWGETPRFLVHDNDAIFGQFGKPVTVERNATPEHLAGPPLGSPAVFAALLPLVVERSGTPSACDLALACGTWSGFGSLPGRTKSYRCHLDRWLDEVMGIEGLPIPYGAPNASPHIERLVRTLREQALNHFIFLSAGHVRRVLSEYIAYYNHARPHQSLHAIPDPYPELKDPPPDDGKLIALPVLGGIRHDYRLAA